MSLAEFLKNVELEDLYKMDTPDNSSTRPSALKTHSERAEQLEPPRTNSLPDVRSTTQLAESTPDRRGKVIRPRSPSPSELSSKSRNRTKRSGSTSLSRQRLYVAIDELWELLPEENKGERIQVSRTQKIEMAVAYLRDLQNIT
jgi:hypothetical protein